MSLTTSDTAQVLHEGDSALGRVDLTYDPQDPYAVVLGIHSLAEDDGVTWTFARSLLADGLREPAGWGDVRITPMRNLIQVTVSSPEGTAIVQLHRDWVARFVRNAHRLVPPGSEQSDVDETIAALLREDA